MVHFLELVLLLGSPLIALLLHGSADCSSNDDGVDRLKDAEGEAEDEQGGWGRRIGNWYFKKRLRGAKAATRSLLRKLWIAQVGRLKKIACGLRPNFINLQSGLWVAAQLYKYF